MLNKTFPTRIPLRNLSILAIALLFLVGGLIIAVRPRAVVGGPVVLMGIDAEDGSQNVPPTHGPIATYANVVKTVYDAASNGGTGIDSAVAGVSPITTTVPFLPVHA